MGRKGRLAKTSRLLTIRSPTTHCDVPTMLGSSPHAQLRFCSGVARLGGAQLGSNLCDHDLEWILKAEEPGGS